MAHTIASTRLPLGSQKTSLVLVGGALGIASTFLAFAILVAACFNLDAVLMLSPLPAALGVIGIVVSIIGGIVEKHAGNEETQPVAAIFCCLVGIAGGMMEMHVWFS